MLESDQYPLLDPAECRRLAGALGDTPDTAIECHALLRNLGRAFAIGPSDAFAAALVEAGNLPAEPHGFARDPAALCALLEGVRGWDCVLVEGELAEPLARLVEERTAWRTRLYESVHLALRQPAIPHRHSAVRLLGTADIPLIEAAPEELRPDGFATLEECLAVGAAAGAVVAGRLVSAASVDALTARFGEISVHTLTGWRGQGMAVYDRDRHDHPPMYFHVFKMFFLCELTGGSPSPSLETDGISFFADTEEFPALSTARVTAKQIAKMFEHHRDRTLPTEFD